MDARRNGGQLFDSASAPAPSSDTANRRRRYFDNRKLETLETGMTLFKHIYNVIAALGRAIAAAFEFYPPLPDGVVRATAAEPIAVGQAVGPTEEEHWIDQAAAIVVEHFAVEPELWRTLGAPAGMLHAALSTMGLTSSQRQMLHRLVMHHRKLNRTAKEIAQRVEAKTIPTGRTGF
jgi:hypothetical protein